MEYFSSLWEKFVHDEFGFLVREHGFELEPTYFFSIYCRIRYVFQTKLELLFTVEYRDLYFYLEVAPYGGEIHDSYYPNPNRIRFSQLTKRYCQQYFRPIAEEDLSWNLEDTMRLWCQNNATALKECFPEILRGEMPYRTLD